MVSTLLSYTSSKGQLKWQESKESLLTFLSSRLQVESRDIQVKDNGTCSVMKAKGMTFNFYTKAKTLQIQGKENANQLRADLVNLACTRTQMTASHPNFKNKMASRLPAQATKKAKMAKKTMKTATPINHLLSIWTVLCSKDLMLPILTLK